MAQEVQSHQGSSIFAGEAGRGGSGKLREADHFIAKANKVLTGVVEPNGFGIPWEHRKDS